jgi:hypothetical protein
MHSTERPLPNYSTPLRSQPARCTLDTVGTRRLPGQLTNSSSLKVYPNNRVRKNLNALNQWYRVAPGPRTCQRPHVGQRVAGANERRNAPPSPLYNRCCRHDQYPIASSCQKINRRLWLTPTDKDYLASCVTVLLLLSEHHNIKPPPKRLPRRRPAPSSRRYFGAAWISTDNRDRNAAPRRSLQDSRPTAVAVAASHRKTTPRSRPATRPWVR